MTKANHILLFLVLLIASRSAIGQGIHVQFVHGSADVALEHIDVWSDSIKLADNLAFRQATPLLFVEGTGPYRFYVCDSTSLDTSNALLIYSDSLSLSEDHVLILLGLQDSTAGYSHFEPLAFEHIEVDLSAPQTQGNTDLYLTHGVTDLGATGLSEIREDLGELLSELPYGQVSSAIELYASRFRFSIEENNEVITQVEADLIGEELNDSVAVLLLSGFYSSSSNLDGAEIQLDLVLKSGRVIELPVSTGRIQFIHNASDPGLEAIDVYLEDQKLLNDLAFRSASGYLALPSGVDLHLSVARDTASSHLDSLTSMRVIVEAEKSYVSLINGLVSAGLDPFEPLQMSIKPSRREAVNPSQTDMLFQHGGIGVSSASIYESSILNTYLAKERPFGSFDVYRSLPFSDYVVDLIDETDGSIIATYDFNLTQFNLEGEAITLVNSGWKDTTSASGLPAMGLWMARAVSGKMIALPLQVGVDDPTRRRLTVFPNPTSQSLHLRSEATLGHVIIHNISGQLVFEEQFTSSFAHIEMSGFSPGVYLLEVRAGNQIHRQQLVVQR
ncbi:MAG: T9SS type A sorting domain-containing protein [Cryomorphaceae bacterium]